MGHLMSMGWTVAFFALFLSTVASHRFPDPNIPGYKINPKPCKVKGQEGTCMFVWECIKVDGVALGMCVEGFMFGSCCALDTDTNMVPDAGVTLPATKRPDYHNKTTATEAATTTPVPSSTAPVATSLPPTPPESTTSGSSTTVSSKPIVATQVAGSALNMNKVANDSVKLAPATTTTKRPLTYRTRPIRFTTARATAFTKSTTATTTPPPATTVASVAESTSVRIASTTDFSVGSTTVAPVVNTSATITSSSTSELTTLPSATATSSTTVSTTTASVAPSSLLINTSVVTNPSVGDTSTHVGSDATTVASTTLVANVTTVRTTPSAKPVTSLPFSSKQLECGVPSMAPRPETRIVGGSTSKFGSWPWQASIRRTSFFGFSSTHRCGGALLNEMWVITAGHCVEDLLVTQIRVRLGEYDFSGTTESLPHVERAINKKVVHPKYNFFTYEHDLALLRLEEAVTFAPHISPICLPASDDLLVGEIATVTGWGRLSEGGTLPSVLQQVSVPIVSNEKCKDMFLKAGRHEYIPEIFMCAGYETGGRDSCQGDSGGPLQIRGRDGRYFLGGIISWGIGCAEANLPGVCTRISKFTSWILDTAT